MITIGITGNNGLLGWHLRSYLYNKENIQVIPADRETFSNPLSLSDFVKNSDVIVHLAGMNRGDEKQIVETNIGLTDQLINTCETLNKNPFIIFSSSTQIFKTTPYAYSKKTCSEHLLAWAKRTGGKFCNLVLPNVFGECGKPFYNSAVSTFCHQIANGEKPQILIDQEIELIHALRVAQKIEETMHAGLTGDVLVRGTPIGVSTLLNKISEYAGIYRTGIIPAFKDFFDLDLFNTYRSYLFPHQYPGALKVNTDQRGYLFEAAKSFNAGQTFISHTKSGITRGNHYHHHKVERFLVLQGKAEIKIRKLFSDETQTFSVNGDLPQYIDMPALHTHNITNTGDSDLITLFWSHGIFDPQNPDTFSEKV